MSQEYYFDVDTVASYLYTLKSNISPLKLQKSLYFLYAYHGAMYGEQVAEGTFEGTIGSPKYLFDVEFQAWQYGPVIREVWLKDRDNFYCEPERMRRAVEAISSESEVEKFIVEMFEQFDSVSDFKLVDRSHQDDSWRDAYNQGQSTPMNNEQIISEYRAKYV